MIPASPGARGGWRVIRLGIGALLLAGTLWVFTARATTRQGINFQVSAHRVPLYVKALDFLHRHEQYRLLARQITEGLPDDAARALAVFRWTREHIPMTPKGWPIVDDHVLHIIIRGHGVDDQMADVFTTLCTYAGVPAFYKNVRPFDDRPTLSVAFAKVDGRWAAFDVANDLIFADAQGQLVAVDALIQDPALADGIAGDVRPSGLPYSRYLAALDPFTVPDILRPEQQMPWPRLRYVVGRALDGGTP